MNTRQSDEQYAKQPTGKPADAAEPKEQDIMKADAEGARSDAVEFAEGDNVATVAEPVNANDSEGNETTIGIP